MSTCQITLISRGLLDRKCDLPGAYRFIKSKISMMNPSGNEIKDIVLEIASIYEEKIRHIESSLNITQQLFKDFQSSFLYAKQEQEKVKIEIRERLAKIASIRRKDFNLIVQEVLLVQEGKESEIRDLLDNSFDEAKDTAVFLKEKLNELVGFFVNGEINRVKAVQAEIEKMLMQQDRRKEVLISKVREFKKEQEALIEKLKNFLVCSEPRIKDLKLIFRNSGQSGKIGKPPTAHRRSPTKPVGEVGSLLLH